MSAAQPFDPPSSTGRPPPPRPPAPQPFGTVAPSTFGHHVVTDRRQPNGAVVAIAWIVTVITLAYMLPWAIAATRGKSNQAAIGLINFFLGWSLVGWIVALVMACQAHQAVALGGHTTVLVTSNGAPMSAPAGWYPAPAGSGRRYWDGTTWTQHHAP